VWVERPATLQQVAGQPVVVAQSPCGSCRIGCQPSKTSSLQLSQLPRIARDTAPTLALGDGSTPVVLRLHSAGLSKYAALVFGLPLLLLFASAYIYSLPSASSLPAALGGLIVALLFVVVAAVFRSVAKRFDSALKLEILRKNPH